MHDCPSCGFPCDCDGEDTYVYAEPFEGCQCDCEGFDPDEDDFLSDPDNWAFIELNQWVMEGYVSALADKGQPPYPN